MAHRLGFADAIAAGLLVDYQIVVLDGRSVPAPHPGAALLAGATGHGLRRILSFHGRISLARALAKAIDGACLVDGRTVTAATVTGTDTSTDRAAALQALVNATDDQLAVVTNVRCWARGWTLPRSTQFCSRTPDQRRRHRPGARQTLRASAGKIRGLVIVPSNTAFGVERVERVVRYCGCASNSTTTSTSARRSCTTARLRAGGRPPAQAPER